MLGVFLGLNFVPSASRLLWVEYYWKQLSNYFQLLKLNFGRMIIGFQLKSRGLVLMEWGCHYWVVIMVCFVLVLHALTRLELPMAILQHIELPEILSSPQILLIHQLYSSLHVD